ncbi:MAG: hypothetical protein II065_03795 [Bacteroidaceae bacterium]|nr:hypothetical protein [Bacteroidaceae bacterium]
MQGAGSDYAVIDGFHIPLDKVKTYNAANADTLILATDGYPQLFPTLAATEAHLQECLHEDPLMLTIHPATKGWMLGSDSFDDRSFLKIKNEGVSKCSFKRKRIPNDSILAALIRRIGYLQR